MTRGIPSSVRFLDHTVLPPTANPHVQIGSFNGTALYHYCLSYGTTCPGLIEPRIIPIVQF
jgi:hypothetical protein